MNLLASRWGHRPCCTPDIHTY